MSNKRHRQQLIGFRVAPEEDAKIRAVAMREGHSVAGFVRFVIMEAVNGRPLALPGADLLALRHFVAEIQRIGLVTRKRAVAQKDAERIVDELRRLQRSVLRWHDSRGRN
jgi:hypothetical protein